MNKIIKPFVKNFLLNKNLRLARITDRLKVLDFLSMIKPVATEHDLIRLGGENDGGYLVPDDLQGIKACFSPGVSQVANFEDDLTKRGVKCFLADYSVDSAPIENKLFNFEKKFLGLNNSEVFMRLDDWIAIKTQDDSELILQMDIEGAEYPVLLDSSPECLRKFRIIVVEFHSLDALFDRMGYELINLTFTKILRDFEIVHIHPNNSCEPVIYQDITIPPVMEFTFLRKDRISSRSPAQFFPHQLDEMNIPTNENHILPKCWY